MVGIEAVKSSTPEICRVAIKEALDIIMNGNEKQLRKFVADYKETFSKAEFEDVAKPTSVNGLEKYSSSTFIYDRPCPAHVRAALLYNNIIKERGLDKAMPISNGDKMKFCYLRVPNPLRENVIGIATTLPRELNLHQYIDYDVQFQKTFYKFMEEVTKLVGWDMEDRATLDSMFEDA